MWEMRGHGVPGGVQANVCSQNYPLRSCGSLVVFTWPLPVSCQASQGWPFTRYSGLAGIYGIGPEEASRAVCSGPGTPVWTLSSDPGQALYTAQFSISSETTTTSKNQPGRRGVASQIALQIFLLKQIVAKCQGAHIFPMKQSQNPPGHFKL